MWCLERLECGRVGLGHGDGRPQDGLMAKVLIAGSFPSSDLFLGRSIRLIHQRVDLLIGGLDLALVEPLVAMHTVGRRD